jgi:integrase
VNSVHVIGTCEFCGGPITGYRLGRNPRFCKRAHEKEFHTERLFAPTGEFRGIIMDYLASTNAYRPRTLDGVRLSLAHFFGFVVQVEGISQLRDIKPPVITRHIRHERDRGVTRGAFVGHLSTFFRSMIAEELVDMSNPVISRIHSQASSPAQPRPFTIEESARLWNLLKEHGDLVLLASFAIGTECGLRVGEVCNIRLGDIDLRSQKIFVRLPTKNMETRTVPFDNQVAKYARLWLKHRRQDCKHDHFIHGDRGGAYESSDLNGRFRRFFNGHPDALAIFKFHRCRHT